jgi:1-acyl-sn-glycerol-3-phosphate acyltransferase
VKLPQIPRLSLVSRLPFPFTAARTPIAVDPLPDKRRTGANYDTEWARSFGARMARLGLLEGVLTPAMEVLAVPDRRGLDRLRDLADADPPQPVIFAANHHSHVDTPLLLSSIPEPWRHKTFVAAAADYFFTSRVRSAASALVLNAIPIERTRVSRRPADDAAALIEDGWSLVIFPEGGRSPDGWGQPFRGGAAYLSLRCHVPVVPVHIEGTGRILRKGKNRPSRSARRCGRARETTPAGWPCASSARLPHSPTRSAPTGTAPGCVPTAPRRPRCRGRTRRRGGGRGRSAIADRSGAARRNGAGPISASG